MDIEQLKLVLQSVDGVTEGAKQIGIGWLALDFLKDILPFAFGIFAVSKTAKLIQASVGESSRIKSLRDIVFPDQVGTEVSSSEVRRMQRLLEQGVKNP